MLVIGHRGACGYRPEHTLGSYALAIEQGADIVEPDLVPTADGVLVCRNGNELSSTTDVHDHPEFATRRRRKTVDGRNIEGWFVEDFTIVELKTLRTRERLPHLRPGSAAFDGREPIPTFAELLELLAPHGGRIAIYPETKHPSYFREIGLPVEERLVGALHAAGFSGRDAPAYLQSFEVGNLQLLRTMTELPIVQLLNDKGRPFDWTAAGDDRSYADLATRDGLAFVAEYADAIGPNKHLVIPRDGSRLNAPTSLVADAHRAGLQVHAWTFRPENEFLPAELRSSDDPASAGDLDAEIRTFAATGLDAIFTDNPDIAVAARARN